MHIDVALVQKLIGQQFPQWASLDISPIAQSGWDNRTFHLGRDMLVRLPSARNYAQQPLKEQKWLPVLAKSLPLPIPVPLALGNPTDDYPWHWSINRWLEGETAATGHIDNLNSFAKSLAEFLVSLEKIQTTDGPLAGEHNFYRGGPLSVYDAETRQAIVALHGKIDANAAIHSWNASLSTQWNHPPVWVHGDISAGNLLVQNGHLSGVLDFGTLGIGDPACDLAIGWTMFHGESRRIFFDTLNLDKDTQIRGRGWTLWKALITAAGSTNPDNVEAKQCWRIIRDVLMET